MILDKLSDLINPYISLHEVHMLIKTSSFAFNQFHIFTVTNKVQELIFLTVYW